MLIHIRSLLSGDIYSQCTALLSEASWTDLPPQSSDYSVVMNASARLQEGAPAVSHLRNLMVGQLERNALFFSAALPRRLYPPVFTREDEYTPEQGSHVDMAIRLLPGTAEQMRADICCTVFLSDPESYEGGELVVEDAHGQHTLKLPAGDAVLYPASRMHRVLPVRSSERITCTLWAESMVREEAHRQTLYDMDISILNLRQTVGDTEAVVRLSACYHNLLRLWATP